MTINVIFTALRNSKSCKKDRIKLSYYKHVGELTGNNGFTLTCAKRLTHFNFVVTCKICHDR